jgi:First Longin domain of INTU, CCZ1 and HPS4
MESSSISSRPNSSKLLGVAAQKQNYNYRIQRLFLLDPTQKSKKIKPIEEDMQDAKNLFYYPESTNIDQQRNHIGLAEGIMNMFNLFHPSDAPPSEFSHINSGNQVHIYLKVEGNLILCLVLKTFEVQQSYSRCQNDYKLFPESFVSQTNSFGAENCVQIARWLYNMIRYLKGLVLDHLVEGELEENYKKFLGRFCEMLNSRYAETFDLLKQSTKTIVLAPFDKKCFLGNFFILNYLKECDPNIKDIFMNYSGYFVLTDLERSNREVIFSLLSESIGSSCPLASSQAPMSSSQVPTSGSQVNPEQPEIQFYEGHSLAQENPEKEEGPSKNHRFCFLAEKKDEKLVILEFQRFLILLSYGKEDECILGKYPEIRERIARNLKDLSTLNLNFVAKATNEAGRIPYLAYNFENHALKVSRNFGSFRDGDPEAFHLMTGHFFAMLQGSALKKMVTKAGKSWIFSKKVNQRLFSVVIPGVPDLKQAIGEQKSFMEKHFQVLFSNN